MALAREYYYFKTNGKRRLKEDILERRGQKAETGGQFYD
jgi:hypothetical protein